MKRRIFTLIFLSIIFFGFFALLAGLSAKSGVSSAKKASASLKSQDLDGAKKNLADSKKKFQASQKLLTALTPLRIIPLAGWYVADTQRGINVAVSGLGAAQTLADALTPYADVLGLKGSGNFLGGTAQERLAKAVETLSKVTPQLDEVGKDLKVAREQMDQIQTWRYPNFLPGRPGEKITTLKNSVDQIESFIADAKPLIEVLPDIMGQNKEKKYLILLQNDKELRPTGGFITAYAIFRVNKGNLASEGSEDIYRLDATLTKKVPAPAPIKKYLPSETFLNIRDSNLSPDYLASMHQFQELYNFTSGKKDIDGIIALNTQFVLSMMKALGPIEVSGNKFTTDQVDACACPQIIYELEKYADEPVSFEKGDRKSIIGVLMQEMIAKTFSAPQSSWPAVLGTVLASFEQKDILLYLKDQKAQLAAEKINFAGRLHEYDGDYLHINEANFGGAKSNMYVQSKIKQNVKKDKDGLIFKKITIEYKYPRRGDNCSLERKGGLCLAGIYRSWIRIYVPIGSTLIKANGTEVPIAQIEDLGKTVFEGLFTLKPEGVGKIEIEYTIPIKVDNSYKLLVQKQSGVINQTYEIDAFGKKQKAFPLTGDKEFAVQL